MRRRRCANEIHPLFHRTAHLRHRPVAFNAAGWRYRLLKLPLSEYPAVTPPTVQVSASYPGANPQVIADTVAAPLEQVINGVDGMLYMNTQMAIDGRMVISIAFEQGTDPDMAQIQVQNRVSRALPRLPEEVQRIGVVTEKTSPIC